jgi:hypothetical protein
MVRNVCQQVGDVSQGDGVPSAPSERGGEQEKVTVSPEQILLYGKRQSRSLHLEVNVIAYFGQLVSSLSSGTVRRSVTGTGVNRLLPS